MTLLQLDPLQTAYVLLGPEVMLLGEADVGCEVTTQAIDAVHRRPTNLEVFSLVKADDIMFALWRRACNIALHESGDTASQCLVHHIFFRRHRRLPGCFSSLGVAGLKKSPPFLPFHIHSSLQSLFVPLDFHGVFATSFDQAFLINDPLFVALIFDAIALLGRVV